MGPKIRIITDSHGSESLLRALRLIVERNRVSHVVWQLLSSCPGTGINPLTEGFSANERR